MKNILMLSKLESERTECCPHCGAVVFKTQPNDWSRSVQQKYTFNNGGDIIGGVYDKLNEEQKSPNSFHYAFNLGYCTLCLEEFFAIEFNFINHNEESGSIIEKTDVGSYLLFNIQMGNPQNYIISQSVHDDIPGEWVMAVFKTPYGNMYNHTIGLLDIERLWESKDILLRLFDSLKLINIKANES